MLPMGLLDDNLFKIHVMGKEAVGKLARPFKPPESPFAALAGDKAAEPAAEAIEVRHIR